MFPTAEFKAGNSRNGRLARDAASREPPPRHHARKMRSRASTTLASGGVWPRFQAEFVGLLGGRGGHSLHFTLRQLAGAFPRRAHESALVAQLNDFGAQLAMLGGHAADRDG